MNAAARISVIGSLLLAAAVSDVVKSEYVSDDEFELEIRHMPDLDQNRAGLANDGQCCCMPTAR